eukprot:TRINITY_DN803_c0_g1_i2.p1 TRINITY_DN803_c0_g1~~TRINITY_DN803_c0_g1_i2.p1  ORF type:complete len:133 (+),score=43.52 TRINITY_DN803_c0_g1_i2:64-462(+)
MKCVAFLLVAALFSGTEALSLAQRAEPQSNATAAPTGFLIAKECEKPEGDADPQSICCKEPEGSQYESYAGGAGPAKIRCCWRVKMVLTDMEQRCGVDCSDSHPCDAALKKMCPKYIDHYKAMKKEICKDDA